MLETLTIPRIVVAALKGGAGKTFLTVGLVAALRGRGLSCAVFKKGPDYIDAGWLGLAAGTECYNLDSYLFDNDVAIGSFVKRSSGTSIAVVEGNRGLFDGVDADGTFSTAELAKALEAPVILIMDATKTTRTAAAMVLGCRILDQGVDIKAVILNRVAGARHELVLRESIEQATGIPVIGSVGKFSTDDFPQRHLGLLPLYEHQGADQFVAEAARIVERSVDLDRVIEIASGADPMSAEALSSPADALGDGDKDLGIGVLKDSAFQFYYPENLEALRRTGARLLELSALDCSELPEIDCLYIGGGFPETHAERLADNVLLKRSLSRAVEKGLPVYAECGGLMYLSRELQVDNNIYPMVGIFPVETILERRPQGHGYIRVEVVGPNPFYPTGTTLTGHEFHYSFVKGMDDPKARFVFRVLRGHGMDGSRDGICAGSALGTYVHVHALGTSIWAEGMLERARE
ncbi:MAG: hydrogenobyrinic acid a,c-diamide synthase (glutamine-hydrolyzing), partial [Deltaproteobacteria bacterium]|nr:hydrogenobyrinic acid a,c-diamide synthase (glutamine-hydrolyzing) [Deltaproteobacteria bacterium]